MNKSLALKIILACSLLVMSLVQPAQAQFNPLGSESPLQLDGQRGFFIMGGLALTSFLASQFSSHRTENYFSNQLGFYNDGFNLDENEQIVFQAVGLEKRLVPWFATSVEFQIQEVFRRNYANVGASLMTYYRWHAFGKKQLSPYFEYGAGVHNGMRRFPEDGTTFTFRLTYKVGLEWNFESASNGQMNKLRLAYGHIHQSNNNLLARNPGYDGNGVTVGLSWNLDR
ncbi:MAG: acyloxyacyl hydrolase [Bacteroidia bacterium]|nr:acyloxyacyl hydrolase [Bacteroidia bacterium]